jgi:hypothetical protein
VQRCRSVLHHGLVVGDERKRGRARACVWVHKNVTTFLKKTLSSERLQYQLLLAQCRLPVDVALSPQTCHPRPRPRHQTCLASTAAASLQAAAPGQARDPGHLRRPLFPARCLALQLSGLAQPFSTGCSPPCSRRPTQALASPLPQPSQTLSFSRQHCYRVVTSEHHTHEVRTLVSSFPAVSAVNSQHTPEKRVQGGWSHSVLGGALTHP